MEASKLTNMRLTSLARMQASASGDFISMSLRDLFDRNECCRERYWNIRKVLRIEHGLKPEGLGQVTGTLLNGRFELRISHHTALSQQTVFKSKQSAGQVYLPPQHSG